jgi:2-keto-3-deoxy-L-rhamnonate aldolase RhmA
VQRLLDAGADGLLVPQVGDLETAARLTRQMVFAPEASAASGDLAGRALGDCCRSPITSRAATPACA